MAKNKMTFKEKMSDILEIPKELMLDIPKITLIGNKQLFIENYKGIIEYEESKVRIKTNEGLIKIIGMNLLIREITADDLMVSGKIKTIEFGE